MPNGTMIGTGLSLEGLSENYVPAELMAEMAWRTQPLPSVKAWIAEYARRRYCSTNGPAEHGWQILTDHVFNSPVKFFELRLPFTALPDLELRDYAWYPFSDVVAAWDNLVVASEKLGDQSGYRYVLSRPYGQL